MARLCRPVGNGWWYPFWGKGIFTEFVRRGKRHGTERGAGGGGGGTKGLGMREVKRHMIPWDTRMAFWGEPLYFSSLLFNSV